MISYASTALQRLTAAAESPGTTSAYAYDDAGNRTGVWLNGTRTLTQTFNAANQVNGLTYDDAGNLTNDGSAAYGYDALNRMTLRSTTPYTYNGDGALVDDGTTQYTQDLAAPLSQVLQTTQGGTTTNYLYGLDRLAAVAGSTRTWYSYDALGSVRMTLDDAGAPLGVVNYDPWGTVESGTVPTFGFTGEVQDVGLVNLRARWYSAGSGTFLSRDPFTGWPKRPYSLHPYQYIGDSPINGSDPSGQWWWGPGQALFDNAEVQFQNQNIHIRIQALVMNGRWDYIHAEYGDDVGIPKVDLLNSIDGEVWEIKPWQDAEQGLIDLDIRLQALEEAHPNMVGRTPYGESYDWRFTPTLWQPGFMFGDGREYYIGSDDSNQWDIYVAQWQPGLLLWWKYPRVRPEPVPFPVLLPDWMVYSKRNVRPAWQPSGRTVYPQPIPVFALPSLNECIDWLARHIAIP